MSSIRPHRTHQLSVSQSSQAMLQVNESAQLLKSAHPWWSFEHLLEVVSQDGFEAALEQALEKNIDLASELLKIRHQIDSSDTPTKFVSAWRNRCFLSGRTEVVIAADAWLHQNEAMHMSVLNRSNQDQNWTFSRFFESEEIAFANVCRHLILVGNYSGSLFVLSLSSGRILTQVNTSSPIVSATIGPQGSIVYSTAEFSALWRGTDVWHGEAFTCLSIRPNSLGFVASDAMGNISLFDIKNGQKQQSTHLSEPLSEILFESETAVLIRSLNGRIWRWDLSDNSLVRIEGRLDDVASMSLSDDGLYLAMGSDSGHVSVIGLKDNSVQGPWLIEAESVESIFWNSESSLWVHNSAGHWYLLECSASDWYLVYQMSQLGVQQCSYSKHNRSVVVARSGGMLDVFTLSESPLGVSSLQPIHHLASDESGQVIYANEEGHIGELDIYNGQSRLKEQAVDGDIIAINPNHGQVEIILRNGSQWSQHGETLSCVHEGDQWVRYAVYSSSGSLAKITEDGCVWVTHKNAVRRIKPPGAVSAAVFTPDQHRLMIGFRSGLLSVLDLNDWQLIRNIPCGKTHIHMLECSRDGTMLLVGTDTGELKLWDFDTNKWRWKKAFSHPLCWADFDSGNKELVVASLHSLVVVSCSDGQIVARHRMVEAITALISTSGNRVMVAAGGQLHSLQWRNPDASLS